MFLFVANAVEFLIDEARRERDGLNTSQNINTLQTKAAARFERTAATHADAAGGQLCGGGDGGGDAGRARRSAMN